MATSRWYGSKPDWLGPRFFAMSPFHSYFFVCDSLLCIMAVLLNLFVLMRYWTTTGSFTHFWLIVNLWVMILFWVKSWQHHERIRRLFQTGALSEIEPGSSVDVVMLTTGSLMNLGLFYFFSVSIGLLNLIANILHGKG